jgi:ribosomal protein S18 acetylase RimI-like enzyme
MKIQKITSYSPGKHDAICRFITLLVENEITVTPHQIEEIISDNNSHLFFAINDDGQYSGMITVGIYNSPTGKKAWIEDVVVDEKFRGEGVGMNLTNFAIQFAKDKGADIVMLTSKPSRIGANKLYRKLGFQQKVTNVYQMALK